ncbi:MAG: hypothetical protein RLZZ161_327 [Bacteroidota bacterium]
MAAGAFFGKASAQQFFEKVNYLGALDKDPKKDWTVGWTNWDPKNTNYGAVTDSTTLNDASGQKDVTGTVTLSASKVYLLKSLLVVKAGGRLIIPAGTVIRGRANTNATPKEYATVVVERGGKINVQGTKTNPVIFTSAKAVGSRDRGDWGGILISGYAVNNQGTNVQVEGFNNIAFNNTLAYFGGGDDADNSGSLEYMRVEFGGYAFEPNKEINGVTFASVGIGTKVEGIQVSFSGDDSYEWFGGTVRCKRLIAYKGTDDDFDTDFGYRGAVQFGIAQKDTSYFDLSWNAPSGASTSETFESDNDAAGSGKLPLTNAVFSNITCVGPVPVGGTWTNMGTTVKNAFRRGARIRRNSRLSIVNSIFMGYRNFVMFDGDSTLTASGVLPNNTVSSTNNFIRNNYFCNTAAAAAKTTTNTGLVEISSPRNVDSLDNWMRKSINKNLINKASYTAGTVLIDPQNKTNPNFRPVSTNSDLYGSSDFDFGVMNSFGSFVVCDSITRQPKSVTVNTGTDVQFEVAYSAGNEATYQWQLNKTGKYTNLSNGGQYSTVSDDTLNVKSITYANNGEKYRCYITTRWCKDSTAAAVVNAILKACTLITSQPVATSGTVGGSANFNISVNDTTAKFAWQADADFGMVTIPASASKYAGSTSKKLTVNNLTIGNHQRKFRAIASTNLCVDTSNTVSLTIVDSCISYKSVKVTDTLLININLSAGPKKQNTIKVFPIPSQDKITIDNGDFATMGGYSIKVYTTTGQLVYSQSIAQKTYTVDLAQWAGIGTYNLQVLDNTGTIVTNRVIILN